MFASNVLTPEEGIQGPLHSITEYYQRLSHEEKIHILGFCQMLTSAMHKDIYGAAEASDSMASESLISSQASGSSSFLEQDKTIERLNPLLNDDNGIYHDVQVNPAKLRTAEMKAMTSKKPQVALLNKVTDLVFTRQELITTQGVKGLNAHKLDALKAEDEMAMLSHYDTSLTDVTSQTPELTMSPSGHRYLVGTRKRTIRDVNFIKGWFRSNGCLPDLETMSESDMNDQLCRFYLDARTKDDKLFTRSSLLGLRASLNRYLMSLPPGRKQWRSILKHPAFATSNRIMNRKSTEERNRDKPPKTVPISPADLTKLMSSKVLQASSPIGLQKKVWLDIVLHFGLRGNKAMWSLAKNSFVLEVDEAGRQYYHLNHDTELPRQEVYSEMKDWYWYSRMYEIADNPKCPVQSLSKYLQKLSPGCNEFFQRAMESRVLSTAAGADEDVPWYRGAMGDQAVMKMMSDMSRIAMLSHIYTNTSVRSTLDELLGKQGVVLDVLFMQKGELITSEALEFKSSLIHNAFYNCVGE